MVEEREGIGGSCSACIKMIFQLYVDEYCTAELRSNGGIYI
jgi:hypothetical protein